jgi:hypothetical protein
MDKGDDLKISLFIITLKGALESVHTGSVYGS